MRLLPAKTESRRLSRRSFLVAGGGFALAVILGDHIPESARAAGRPFEPTAWIRIGVDGTVTILCGASEMGQGVHTALPMLVAEDLDADWSRVRVEQAPSIASRYGNPAVGGIMLTGASRSVVGYYKVLRIAGLQARNIMVQGVARQWKVPVSELSTANGVVTHAPSKRSISYGDVVKFAEVPAELPIVEPANLRSMKDFRILGTSVPRLDIPAKTNGAAQFGIDVQVDDALYAMVLRGPEPGSRPVEIDDAAARRVSGITHVVRLPYGVAVLGETYDAVRKGRAAVSVSWQAGAREKAYDSARLLKEFAAIGRDLEKSGLQGAGSIGDAAEAIASAAKRISADYAFDHVYHATLEPMNATARMDADDGIDIWISTQAPTIVQLACSAVLQLPPDRIRVHTTLLGGGFGRRLEPDVAIDAALLAKATKRAVKVLWSREDDVKNDKYRPLAAINISAGVSPDGKVVGLRHRIVADSIGARYNPKQFKADGGKDNFVTDGSDNVYEIANQLNEYLRQDVGIPVGYWRAVGPGYTKFALETFIDELAAMAGTDPISYRLQLLEQQPRAQAVLRTVADMARWGSVRTGGRALGFAYSDHWGSHIAEIAEVSLERRQGAITVHNVWCAVDCGTVVHPDIVKAQIEGAVTQGVGAALYEKIDVVDGIVQQSNFHDYRLIRMSESPSIDVKVLATDHPPGGLGEIGLPPIAPAIANGIARLTGKRMRQLPMLPERVLAVLSG